MAMPTNILFVCTGNACRSVMAERLLKKMLADAGIDGVRVASCGTEASPLFRVPPVVTALLVERGTDAEGHVSTLIQPSAVEQADIIFVMEDHHRSAVLERFPGTDGKVFLLKEYAHYPEPGGLPDPIGQSDAVYRKTAEEIEWCLSTILNIWREP